MSMTANERRIALAFAKRHLGRGEFWGGIAKTLASTYELSITEARELVREAQVSLEGGRYVLKPYDPDPEENPGRIELQTDRGFVRNEHGRYSVVLEGETSRHPSLSVGHFTTKAQAAALLLKLTRDRAAASAAYAKALDLYENPRRTSVKKKSRKKARGSKKKHAKRSTRRKAKKAAAKKRRATKKRKPTKARKPSRKRKQTRRPKSAKKKRPAKARAKRRGRPLVGSHKGLTKKCRKCNRVHSAHAHDAHGHGAHRRVHGGIGASKRRTGMRMPLAKNCGPCAKNPHGYPHELPSRGRVFVRFGVHPRTGKRSVVIVHADGKTSWPVVRDGRIKFPRRVPKKFRREVEQAFRAIGLSRNPIGPVLGVVSGNPRRGKKRCGSPAHGTAALALRAFLAKQPEGKRIPHARLPREIQGNAVWLRAARLEAKRLGIPLARVVLEVRHTDLKGISPALAHVGRELAVEYRDARGKGWRHTAGDHGRGRKKTKAPDIAADPRTGAEIRLGGRGVRRKFTSRGLVG